MTRLAYVAVVVVVYLAGYMLYLALLRPVNGLWMKWQVRHMIREVRRSRESPKVF